MRNKTSPVLIGCLGLIGFSVLIGVLSSMFTASAETGAKVKALVNPRPAYSQAPFDLNATQLPANFKGHDITLLYGAFHNSESKKSEYETTKEFENRLEQARRSLVVGTLMTTSTLAFVIPEEMVGQNYDADRQLLNVTIRITLGLVSGILGSDLWIHAFVIKTISGAHSTYLASNAYGATVKVSKDDYSTFGLEMGNLDDFSIGNDHLYFAAAIPIDVLRARSIKGTLTPLVVCAMNKPLTSEHTSHTKPTLDFPFADNVIQHYLNAKVLSIWFFDSSSGEVYAKIQRHK